MSIVSWPWHAGATKKSTTLRGSKKDDLASRPGEDEMLHAGVSAGIASV
jgi:hypothetical protein